MKRKTAFTLIELLVVISIIALLVAILMPALGRARQQARNTVCLTNMKQWGTLFTMYTNDHNDHYMPGWAQEWKGIWMYALEKYYGGSSSRGANPNRRPGGVDDIRLCPVTNRFHSELEGTGQASDNRTAWGIWTNNDRWQRVSFYGSYGVNWWINDMQDDTIDIAKQVDLKESALFWRTNHHKNANRIPVLADMTYWLARPHHTNAPPPRDGVWRWEEIRGGMERVCVNRHAGGVNVLFMDSSVRRVELKQLWTLKWHRQFDTTWAHANAIAWPDWMKRLP